MTGPVEVVEVPATRVDVIEVDGGVVVAETTVVEVVETSGTVVIRGEPGPAGPEGPQGPPGADSIEHHQTTPAAAWPIEHNLGRRPAVYLIADVGDGPEQVFADVTYPDLNHVLVTWPDPMSGTAVIP